MKFEFDSNNATELRAVESAVAVLLGKQAPLTAETDAFVAASVRGIGSCTDPIPPLVAAVTEAQEALGRPQLCKVERSVVVQTETGVHKLQTGVHDLGNVKVAVSLPGEDADLAQALADADLPPLPVEDLDSAGQPWNSELHSSSRAKVADGTWKKKRGVGKAEPEQPAAPVPPTPPAPPAAPAPAAETKIWALITGQVVTLNRVLEVARDHGFADLGALRLADEAAKAKVLAVLEGE